MKRALIACSITLIAAAWLVYGVTRPSVAAQESITGDWTAKIRETPLGTVLWLSTTSNSADGRRNWQMSNDFPLSDFSGLNPNAGANAQFSMQREAGTVVFTGLFSNGKGVGEFRFTPSGAFINTMRGLGYEELSTDKLFTMTIHDVGTRFIGELKSLGYDKVPVNKLIAMRIHRADGDFIREIESAGYKQVPVDKLIAMRIHNVNGKFVREMRESGFNNLSVDDLIKLRIHGVDSQYVKRMKGDR